MTFAPAAAGARTASLTILNDDGDENPYRVALTGTGFLAPEIAVFTGASTAPADERTNNTGTQTFASTIVAASPPRRLASARVYPATRSRFS